MSNRQVLGAYKRTLTSLKVNSDGLDRSSTSVISSLNSLLDGPCSDYPLESSLVSLPFLGVLF